MREQDELPWQPCVSKNPLHLRQILNRTQESFGKTVTDTLLEVHVVRGSLQYSRRLALEQCQYPFLIAAEIVSLPGGKCLQDTAIALLVGLHNILPLLGRFREVREGVINNRELIRIVQHTALGV